jgi:hypothetical protein
MFSRKDTSFDLADEMEKNLRAFVEAEVSSPINKVASAIEYLNRAAEIFDESGLHAEAEIATRLLEVFAARKGKAKKKPSNKSSTKSKSKPSSKSKSKSSKKPSGKKSDPATKGLDSKKMIENLEHKGWVFNADDGDIFNADDMNFAAAEVVVSEGVKDDQDHEEGCDCAMCSEMGDMGNMEMGMADDAEHIKDEHEADLARIMSDLDDAEHAHNEMFGGEDFEDDLGGEYETHPMSHDMSRSMRYFGPGNGR